MSELIDRLNFEVTGALFRSRELRGKERKAQQVLHSHIEYRLSQLHPPTCTEGDISRQGAVRAALKSGNRLLAEYIANEYLSDPRTPKYLASSIKEIIGKSK